MSGKLIIIKIRKKEDEDRIVAGVAKRLKYVIIESAASDNTCKKSCCDVKRGWRKNYEEITKETN